MEIWTQTATEDSRSANARAVTDTKCLHWEVEKAMLKRLFGLERLPAGARRVPVGDALADPSL